MTAPVDFRALLEAGPFPLAEQLSTLAAATRHLLDHHDCDCHGWEVWQSALAAYDPAAANSLPHLLDRLERTDEALRMALAELGPERVLKLAALSALDEQEPR